MPAYLISGPSGSGKSSVWQYLKDHGYTAIETDLEQGLSSYVHKETGEKKLDYSFPLPQEWLDAHAWNWDEERMKELFEEYKNVKVFFCGGAHNEKNYFDWFDRRFALCVDNNTLKKRLQQREPQRWLDNSPELNNMLAWNTRFREYSIGVGATLIDSSQTPEKVAKDILKIVNEE